ncbi:MAG: hypothetical protein RL084_831, partial [Pseudomonadota bacterium]
MCLDELSQPALAAFVALHIFEA